MRTEFATIAREAASQHGRIAHRQLLAAGIDRDTIKRWCCDGRLHAVHVRVYAVGHTAPSLHADLMAAALAGGTDAVVSHRSAGHALKILRKQPPRPEITVPTRHGRRRAGIVVHRVKALHVLDTGHFEGIPMTSPARVLLDLAPALELAELTRACHEAWIHHRVTPAGVQACIGRNPTKKGARKLLRALGADATLSRLEDGFLALLARHGLPRPRTNIDHLGDKVDCHWPEVPLTVELLSFRFHATRKAFEDDVARRRRSDHLAYTWGDVFERGAQTVAELACQLSA
ncbi:MAG: type IV toxin-antitoxin system AbiEi family antitoxin [Solirubrobacteraceae bacterium]